jgi:hypothetical protein
MSDQTKVTQAENALESVQHAVDQAESHPSADKIGEADRALRHTAASVGQALESGGEQAESLEAELQEERAVLEGTSPEEQG